MRERLRRGGLRVDERRFLDLPGLRERLLEGERRFREAGDRDFFFRDLFFSGDLPLLRSGERDFRRGETDDDLVIWDLRDFLSDDSLSELESPLDRLGSGFSLEARPETRQKKICQ